ncbi:MAG: hypothetical protein ACRD1T_00985 [Acidimicrobiia bacterium]
MLEVSEKALEVLERASSAASRLNPDAKVRVYRRADEVEIGLADAPEETDEVFEVEGVTIFVEQGISGTLDVSEEHDRLIVVPNGPNGPNGS